MADSDDRADKIYVPEDRVFERTQGCWNCIHAVNAKEWWNQKRQQDLAKAISISTSSKLGEQHPKVFNIRKMVDTTDKLVASHAVIRCGGGLLRPGRTAKGDPVGDLVASNYLCDRWSAAQGASVARAGQKADALPEELADKVGNAMPDADKLADEIKRNTGGDN